MEKVEVHLSRWPFVRHLEADGQLVGVGGMQQALADLVRPLRTELLLNTTVEHHRYRAVHDGGVLALAERVENDAEALAPVDGDRPRTARRPGRHRARSRRRDVAGLVGKSSMSLVRRARLAPHFKHTSSAQKCKVSPWLRRGDRRVPVSS